MNQNDPAFEFLDHIWPQDGHVLVHAKKGDAAPWQKIFQNIGDALAWLRQLDAQGFNCYHHIGSVRDPQGVWDPKKNNGKGGYKKRGRGNVHRLKVLVADIDTNELGTKPNAPYKNRAEALAAVEAFCQAARIPPPTIVSSGTGLHCYWVLIEELDFETWQPLADSFKAACFHYGLKIDPPRSADATSVLRTPTMRHQSSGRIVEVITELTRPYPVSAFAHLLEQLPSKRRQAKSSKLASTEQTSSGPQILDALRNVEPPPSDILYEREKLWSLLNHVGTDGQRTFDPDWSYPEWCEGVLMAIASTGWPCALDIAIWWSAQAKTEGKYPGPEAIRAKMTSFTRERGPNTTTERSLYKRALDRGWKEPPPSHEAQLELAERATRNTIETALQEDAPKTPDTRNAYFETDLGNAKRLVARFGADIRFVPERKCWIVWDGTRWRIDSDGAIMRLAKQVTVEMLREAVSIEDSDKRDRQVKHALKCQAAPRLAAMVMLASTEAEVVISIEKLDTNPWLLGVLNGVIDLRRGEFREARREDFITMQASVVFDETATCPNWDAFQIKITAGKRELIEYKQRASGYCLTGLVREEVLFLWWGTGDNGKSTERETFHYLLGDYAIAASAGLLVEKRDAEGATPEVARLKGRRLVTINETKEGDALNEGRVKFITSHDTISARYLHENPFDFYPTHKTIVTTNHKPVIHGTDHGIWKRIHLWPYDVKIPKDEIEREFRERKLIPEASGILNWMIEGLRMYQQEGLNPPAAVQGATADYRQDMDVIGQWIDECCIVQPEASVASSVAFDNYKTWAITEAGWHFRIGRFRRYLTDRGFGGGSDGRQRMIRGLALKPPEFARETRAAQPQVVPFRRPDQGAEKG